MSGLGLHNKFPGFIANFSWSSDASYLAPFGTDVLLTTLSTFISYNMVALELSLVYTEGMR